MLRLRDVVMRHSADIETQAVLHPGRNLIDTGGIVTLSGTLRLISRAPASLDPPAALEAP